MKDCPKGRYVLFISIQMNEKDKKISMKPVHSTTKKQLQLGQSPRADLSRFVFINRAMGCIFEGVTRIESILLISNFKRKKLNLTDF